MDRVVNGDPPVLSIKATGRGSYQRTRLDAFGFSERFLTRTKAHFGFVTGDLVRAVVTKGKKIGSYLGRVAVRSSGS
ncbi:HNH endonuclease, partial [mine drainage metagenome]